MQRCCTQDILWQDASEESGTATDTGSGPQKCNGNGTENDAAAAAAAVSNAIDAFGAMTGNVKAHASPEKMRYEL